MQHESFRTTLNPRRTAMSVVVVVGMLMSSGWLRP